MARDGLMSDIGWHGFEEPDCGSCKNARCVVEDDHFVHKCSISECSYEEGEPDEDDN